MSKYGTMLSIFVLLGGSLWLAQLEGGPANPISGVDDSLSPSANNESQTAIDQANALIDVTTNPSSEFAFISFLILFPIAGIMVIYMIDTLKDLVPFT